MLIEAACPRTFSFLVSFPDGEGQTLAAALLCHSQSKDGERNNVIFRYANIHIYRHDWSYLGTLAKTPDTPQSVTRNLRNLRICAPIRTKYMYNNMMYTVATYLVEAVD